jgi:hypothetical protein
MDMSSLGGFSSFAGNQSQNLSFAGNQSQGMSMISTGSAALSRSDRSSATRKSALERKLEKVNEVHRQQLSHYQQQQQQQQQHQHQQQYHPQQATQTFTIPTHKEPKTSNEHNMQSINSLGFEAIDQDEVTEASCKLSNLGFSEMDMTFNSEVLSIRSKSEPKRIKNEFSDGSKATTLASTTKQPGESKTKAVTASSIFDRSLGSSFNNSNISAKKEGFNNSNISMDDFNESFKSMDMGERERIGPIDPDGDVPVSGTEKKAAAISTTRRPGRQREPAGGRLPSIQSGMRSSGGAAADIGMTKTSHRGSAERNSGNTMSTGLGISNASLGLSDPLMGDFGLSMTSLRSFQSQGSDASWLNQYQSMENVQNDSGNPWDDECGSANSSMSEISAPRMIEGVK